MLGDAYLKTGDKANARNAFLFCADNFSYPAYKEISKFNYGKLSYELGYDNEALSALRQYVQEYPAGKYATEAKEHLINLLAKSSNYKDALSLYESITVQNERTRRLYPVILFNRAQQLLADRDMKGANALFDKAIAAPYNDDVKQLASFWKGETAFASEQYADAVAYYTQYLRKPVAAGEVTADNATYNLGHAYLRLEQYAKARTEFEKLAGKRLQSADMQEDVSARLADCMYMQKDFRRAQTMYQPLSTAGGKQADYATYQLGLIAGAQGKPADKISTLRTIETLFPASMLVIPSQMEIANSYLADEKYKDALPFLQKIIKGKGGEYLKPEAYLKAGIASYNLDNNKDALDYFSALLKQFPNAPESEDAIDNIRSIYVEQGKPDEFVKYMQGIGRAVNQQTADSLSYATAELQLSAGKKELAAQSLKSYLQQYPQGRYAIEVHYNLAELSREKGDQAQALASYEQVIMLAPNKYAERSLLAASRMAYFDKKDYKLASGYYKQLKESATSAANKLEGMRGLVRCQYYTGSYADAVDNARELMNQSGAGADDKIFASLVLGKHAQSMGNCTEAIGHYRTVSNLSKAEYGAEARYQTAACHYAQARFADAEKASFEVVKKDGSYVLWVTKSYILLGDIFLAQKDYFNAKATYKSVAENASIKELKDEASEKLVKAEAEEAASGKVTGN